MTGSRSLRHGKRAIACELVATALYRKGVTLAARSHNKEAIADFAYCEMPPSPTMSSSSTLKLANPGRFIFECKSLHKTRGGE
jgi:hypothetical protein